MTLVWMGTSYETGTFYDMGFLLFLLTACVGIFRHSESLSAV